MYTFNLQQVRAQDVHVVHVVVIRDSRHPSLFAHITKLDQRRIQVFGLTEVVIIHLFSRLKTSLPGGPVRALMP